MNIRQPLLGAALALLLGTSALAAVDANKASQGELESVKGVGPSLSGKILDARKTAPFKDWDDLQARVKGVGPANASRLSNEGLTVNGTALGATAPASAPATAAAPTAESTRTAKAKTVVPARK